jgi:hypothetical protein
MTFAGLFAAAPSVAFTTPWNCHCAARRGPAFSQTYAIAAPLDAGEHNIELRIISIVAGPGTEELSR